MSRGPGGLALGLDPRPVPGEGSLAEILLCLPQCRHQRLIEIIWSLRSHDLGEPLQEKQVENYGCKIRCKALGKAGVSGEPWHLGFGNFMGRPLRVTYHKGPILLEGIVELIYINFSCSLPSK